MASRIRKAIVGGISGGVSAVAGSLVITGIPTKEDVAKALGLFIVGFGVTAYAVWRTPNATV